MHARFASRPTLESHPLPRHVAVIGAAGGLGQGILSVCREEGIGFTAIVRSRTERITDVPPGSRVAVVSSLADRYALTVALAGADAVLTALGVTSTSRDRSAVLSENMETVEQAMLTAGVDRIVVTNTLLTSSPGKSATLLMRFFSEHPGITLVGANMVAMWLPFGAHFREASGSCGYADRLGMPRNASNAPVTLFVRAVTRARPATCLTFAKAQY
jgi:hypothetical protein